MKDTLLLVTHNQHKAHEIDLLFKTAGLSHKKLITLASIGDHEAIPETGLTLSENALQKAREGARRHQKNCFADDTGLEVEALGGAPGIYTARYAGEHCSPEDNIDKLLRELGDNPNRRAIFKTVIALIYEGREYLFEGEVKGTIATQKSGIKGFGYDPIFIPEGKSITFAEMQEADKNKISHRGRAFQKLITFFEKEK